MQCVILYRNTQNNCVGFISEVDPDQIAVFSNWERARHFADKNMLLRAFPYQIVELDDITLL